MNSTQFYLKPHEYQHANLFSEKDRNLWQPLESDISDMRVMEKRPHLKVLLTGEELSR